MSSLNKNSSIGQYNILTAINYDNQLDTYLPSSFLKKWIGWFGICLSLSFFLNIPAYAEDRALIIGIDKYQYIGGLPGCVTDANNIRQLVLNLNIYKSDQIRLLTDDKATRKAILEGLQWLVDGSHAGDKVLFYFSGHGTQQSDTNGDEDDRLDETLCPVDTSANFTNMVVDDEINDYLQKLAKRKVLVVVDACHSGTITKNMLPKDSKFKTPIFNTPLSVSPKAKSATSEQELIAPSGNSELIVYTAVNANQMAIATQQGSIFTNSFIEAIKQNPDKISNNEILEIVRKKSEIECNKRQATCTPQMYLDAALGDKPFVEIFTPVDKPVIRRDLILKILPSSTLSLGSEMTFEIENPSQQDGYVVIWDVSSVGKVALLFPNSRSGDNKGFVKSGQTITIPNENDENDDFVFRMQEPKGKGVFLVVLANDESVAQQLQVISMDSVSLKKPITPKMSEKGVEIGGKNNKDTAREVVKLVKQKLATQGILENSMFIKDYEVTN